MKVGVISDTHDNLEVTEKAVEFFTYQGVDTVIHCGDMISPFIAELFDQEFEFYAVKGNNDGEWDLKETVEEFGTWLGEMGELELAGERFGIYHGTEPGIVRSMVESGEYDYVLKGHTHQKIIRENDGTVELNPGGIRLPDQEEVFHVATVDLGSGEIDFHRVEKG